MMMQHYVVMDSGGVMSYLAAKRVVATVPKDAGAEKAIVHRHHDASTPCDRVSSMDKSGEDLHIGPGLPAEVKARKNGQGCTTLERWLGNNAALWLKRNHTSPMVVVPWSIAVQLMKAYCVLHDEEIPNDRD